MIQKLLCSGFHIHRVGIHAGHVHLRLHIAAGGDQDAGNVLHIILMEGQLQDLTGLDLLILLVGHIDITGSEHLAAAADSRILQRDGNISVLGNQIGLLGLIAQL